MEDIYKGPVNYIVNIELELFIISKIKYFKEKDCGGLLRALYLEDILAIRRILLKKSRTKWPEDLVIKATDWMDCEESWFYIICIGIRISV